MDYFYRVAHDWASQELAAYTIRYFRDTEYSKAVACAEKHAAGVGEGRIIIEAIWFNSDEVSEVWRKTLHMK